MKEYIRITSIQDGQKLGMEIPADGPIAEVLSLFRAFLLAKGYHPDTVYDALGEDL